VAKRDDDIPDPYRADMTRAWNTAEQVVATVGAAAAALGFLQDGAGSAPGHRNAGGHR
jgi:hypothetical protein